MDLAPPTPPQPGAPPAAQAATCACSAQAATCAPAAQAATCGPAAQAATCGPAADAAYAPVSLATKPPMNTPSSRSSSTKMTARPPAIFSASLAMNHSSHNA